MYNNYFLTFLSNEIRIMRTDLIKIIVLVFAILLCGTLDSPAQSKRIGKKSTVKTIAKNAQADKTDSFGTVAVNPIVPITIVNSAETDFLSWQLITPEKALFPHTSPAAR